MRRYWFSIAIVLLAVSGIGIYYLIGIQNHYPAFKIETVQGDATEGAAVVLSGSYLGKMRSEFLNVTVDGSKYSGETMNFRTELIDANSWFYQRPEMQQLLRDHKSFMREKVNAGGFYRDEEMVIYAGLSTDATSTVTPKAKMKLSFLYEETGKVVNFKAIELESSDHLYSIIDVQRVDDEVHILLHNYNNQKIVMDYVFDIHTGKKLRQVDVRSMINKEHAEEIELTSFQSDNLMSASHNVFFVGSTENRKEGEVSHYVYSYKTGILTKLDELLWEGGILTYSLQNELFYYTEIDPSVVTLSLYNTETKERKRAYAAVTAEQLGVDKIKSAVIQSNRLYLLLVYKSGDTGTAVVDLATGELLFQGRVAQVDGTEMTAEERRENLRLLNMTIDQRVEY